MFYRIVMRSKCASTLNGVEAQAANAAAWGAKSSCADREANLRLPQTSRQAEAEKPDYDIDVLGGVGYES